MEDEIRGMPMHYWMSKFAQAEVGEIVGMAYRYQAKEEAERYATLAYHRVWATEKRPKKSPQSVGVAELPLTFAQDRRVRRMMRLAEVCG